MGHFQSLDRIYIYDTKAGHFKIIASKNKIIKSFSKKFHILSNSNEGLLKSKAERPLVSNPFLKNNRIVNVFATDGVVDSNTTERYL
jgi:hypothetical protein